MTQVTINQRYNVTDAQLDSVTYFTDEATRTPLFKVHSATDADTVYTVKWNSQYNRPQCECKAACDGRVCWHVRACLAVLSLHAQARRDQADIARQIALDTAELEAEREACEYAAYRDDCAMQERVANATPYNWPAEQIEHDAQRYAPRPFSLLR